MAPRKPPVAGTETPPETPPLVFPTQEEDIGDSTWRALIELGEQSEKILLHRRYQNGRYGFLTEYTPEEFSLVRVRDDYGAGDYVAQFIDARKRETGKQPFTIDSPPKKEPDPVPVLSAPTVDPSLKVLIEQQGKILEKLVERLDTQPAQNKNNEVIDLAIRLAEVMRPQTPAERPFEELASVFKAGAEAARGSNDEDGGGYLGVVQKFAPTLARLVDAAVSQRMGIPPSAPPPPRAISPPPVPVQPRQPEVTLPTDAPSWMIHLVPHVPTIMGWAQAGKDPNLYAEVILDNVGAGAALEIAEAAKADDFVDKTMAALPMFKPYTAWARAVLTQIKLLSTQEDSDDHEASGG